MELLLTEDNYTILGHSGGWYGIHTELMNFMEDHYTVIILSNIDDGGKTGASKVSNFSWNYWLTKKLRDNVVQ